MSVFGALLMYIVSMLSLFKLRRTEPHLVRPFRAPFYPYSPAFALICACICMVTMIYYNLLIFGIFCLFLALAYVYHAMTVGKRSPMQDEADSNSMTTKTPAR